MTNSGIVTLLTDFGLRGPFVGVMKASVLARCPRATLVDLTHDIEPGCVADAAFWLAQAAPWFPPGAVHVAVVDPGVGTSREALVARAFGHTFIGPDNGVFEVVQRKAPSFECRRVELARVGLTPPSRTFHGRDLFAPAAAHLANGVPLDELGPPLDPDALVRLDLPRPSFSEDRIEATMLYVDSFGNIALNLTRDDAEHAGVVPGTRVELELAGERYFAVMARTFADARPGDVILYEDSYRNMSIAINRGNAASMLHAGSGRDALLAHGQHHRDFRIPRRHGDADHRGWRDAEGCQRRDLGDLRRRALQQRHRPAVVPV